MENEDLARIWRIALNDGDLNDIEKLRLENLWIDLVNTQRSNFVRAKVVGDEGLARQAVISIAAEIYQSEILLFQWEIMRPWCELATADFVGRVDEEIGKLQEGGLTQYQSHVALDREG
ncbi:MAG: hypothetical protein QGG67_16150 [Gammaproteobacteria bacterium]|jgi:hypothetical protein|nr:hypothetical protein [Gammaproteobacteria bacterium]